MSQITTGTVEDAATALHDAAGKIAESADHYSTLAARFAEAAQFSSSTSLDEILETLTQMETEVQLSIPHVLELQSLYAEVEKAMIRRMEKAATDITTTGTTKLFGPTETGQAEKFALMAARIRNLANKKTDQINALAAALDSQPAGILAAGSTPPPQARRLTTFRAEGMMDVWKSVSKSWRLNLLRSS